MKVILCLAICVVGIFADEENKSGWNIPGGRFAITEQDKIAELEEKIHNHLSQLAAGKPNSNLKLVETKSANYRIAAGPIYELIGNVKENDATVECTISLWEQPWHDFSKLNVECGEEKRPYEWIVGSEGRRKRSPQIITGGLHDVSASTLTDLTENLRRALVKVSTDQGTNFELRRIISAKSQVIAGVRYVVTAELAVGSEVKTCTAEFIHPVSGSYETSISCDDKKYTL